ncbi:MAG: sel1 repeat family protein [Magnetococcales bacterium]|nr:sel1 repeat family protein [Magnetococcales bacterium]
MDGVKSLLDGLAAVLMIPVWLALGLLSVTALAEQPLGNVADVIADTLRAANQGNVDAQVNLGYLYQRGQGVPQNDIEMMKWYHAAATRGHAAAQIKLGSVYYEGKHTPRDYVQAYLWYQLAALQGYQSAVEFRDYTAKSMTPEQLLQAKRLVQDWMASPPNSP